LLRRFSVADAYLFTVLTWSLATPVDLKEWPVLADFRARLGERKSVARAFAEELDLYRREQARTRPATR
jgi:glutathione S-transferase